MAKENLGNRSRSKKNQKLQPYEEKEGRYCCESIVVKVVAVVAVAGDRKRFVRLGTLVLRMRRTANQKTGWEFCRLSHTLTFSYVRLRS